MVTGSPDTFATMSNNETPSRVLILDFGSQYSHLIVRRCREVGVYSELVRCDTPLQTIRAFGAAGIILSGGPSSVYEEDAPHVPEGFWKFAEEAGVPVLGICYGMQDMQHALGGKVEQSTHREFGSAEVKVLPNEMTGVSDCIFNGITESTHVWMSHGDRVTSLAPGFEVIGTSDNSPYAAVVDRHRKFWGLQFHPEVTHTVDGLHFLTNFVGCICGASRTWNMNMFAHTEISRLRDQIGNRRVIGALSGGVDSTVGAALLHSAIGDRFHGFMVNTGLLRKNEGPEVIERLRTSVLQL